MTDVATIDSDMLREFLSAADDAIEANEPEQATLDIIARILDATSVDDVLGREEAVHARDFLGKPFTLTGVKFNRSDFEGSGPAFYALLSGADADGVPVLITCGARHVMAQAWKMNREGWLPAAVELRQSDKATAAGYHVMWLEKAEAGF